MCSSCFTGTPSLCHGEALKSQLMTFGPFTNLHDIMLRHCIKPPHRILSYESFDPSGEGSALFTI